MLPKKEFLPSNETADNEMPKNELNSDSFTASQVRTFFIKRRKTLELIKKSISLKYYYQIAEKIQREEKQLKTLLDLDQKKQDSLARYSFVLDPGFFEQRFIKKSY